MSKNTKIIPIGEKILVEPIQKDSGITKSGIIIPDTVDKEKPEKGKVIAVGEGRTTDAGDVIEPIVKVGQIVIFTKYGPDVIEVDGVEYYVLTESNILAIIE